MKWIYAFAISLFATSCVIADDTKSVKSPGDVPPVHATAMVVPDEDSGELDTGRVMLRIPKVAWKIVGEERPKQEWPEIKVSVKEVELTIETKVSEASQLSEHSQDRVLDLEGNRLSPTDLAKRLKIEAPVLVSVSGRMPDAYYLQCLKPDTLIAVLGLPSAPAPDLLPHPAKEEAATSFKGWEVYVWEERGSTYFSLMVGTNRIKSDEEIQNSAVQDFKTFKSQLDGLKEGEFVTIHGRRLGTEAPGRIGGFVSQYCQMINLKSQ